VIAVSIFHLWQNQVTTRSTQRNVYSTTIEHGKDFYDAHDGAVFDIDTDVSELLSNVTDFKPHGASTARYHKSSFILRDEWLKLSTEKREVILANRSLELCRTSSSNGQHCLPTRTANAHEFHNVVNIDDIIECSKNKHMSANSHEHEASMYPTDSLYPNGTLWWWDQWQVSSISKGKQRILMNGHQIPLAIRNRLPYLPCWSPTATEVASLPHLMVTSDVDWDPKTYDNVISDIHNFYDTEADMVHHITFADCCNYHHRTVATHNTHPDPEYFDVHEYPDYSDVIDHLLGALYPAVSQNK
jgi:hypothetical protein